MTRARTLIVTSPLWVSGLLLGIAIAEGVVEVVRKEWALTRNSRRADRAYDEWRWRR